METTPGKPPRLSGALDPPALLERDAELALVERLLAATETGEGAVLLFEGPAGTGKSRLLAAACERAEARGFQTLRARGGELERDYSYGVVRQLFEAHLAGCGADERASLLSGAAGLAAPLFDHAPADSAPTGAPDTQFPVLHGLFWLTATLAERRPVLLAVDDLQWCDSASQRFVSYLARRLDGLPVTIAVSVRTGEPEADATALAELEAQPLAHIVRPGPLSPAAVARFLESALERRCDPAFLTAVYEASAGNPLCLHEVVRAVAAEGIEPTAASAARVRELGPETLSRFVLRRLRRLGDSAEALARAVAILGDESELQIAAALAELDIQDAARAAASLAHVEILRPAGRLGFVHPVVRAAVHATIGGPERELAHERAAELLAASGASATALAAHLLHVAPRARPSVVASLRVAAGRAIAQGDPGAAAAYLERALAEPPGAGERAGVLLELGEAEISAALPGATGHLEEAHALLTGDAAAEAALALAESLYAPGRVYDATDVLQRAIAGADRDPALARRMEARLIHLARFDARVYPLARDRLAGLADAIGDDSSGRLLQALAASELTRAGEQPERARQLVQPALADSLALSEHENWQAHGLAVGVLLSLDELDEAARRSNRWLEIGRARGSAFSFAHASGFHALAMLRSGRLAEAEADARAALAVAPYAGKGGNPEIFGYLTETLLERGEIAEAAAMLERAGIPDPERPTYQMARWLEVRARLEIASGAGGQGLEDLLAAGERMGALGVVNPSHSAWRSQAALALHARDERGEARRLVGEEVELARRWGAPRPLGAALRAAGLVEGGAGGLALLRESTAVLAGSPAQLERARSLTELGAALRRANQRAEARGILAEALELAELCDATPVAERAHAELLATGARPRRIARSGVAALTPSEHRVARMAAAGQTNREIAQALFVTPKTVEMHLSHVYRKLEIQARSQLARAFA
jgi:DNA-binding CsgD family transcriptional regulator